MKNSVFRYLLVVGILTSSFVPVASVYGAFLDAAKASAQDDAACKSKQRWTIVKWTAGVLVVVAGGVVYYTYSPNISGYLSGYLPSWLGGNSAASDVEVDQCPVDCDETLQCKNPAEAKDALAGMLECKPASGAEFALCQNVNAKTATTIEEIMSSAVDGGDCSEIATRLQDAFPGLTLEMIQGAIGGMVTQCASGI